MSKGTKVCVWLKDGRSVEAKRVSQSVVTEPRHDEPVFIVAFDKYGQFEQADIYHYDGYTISINRSQSGAAWGPNVEALEF